jgi:hypothetical protein
MKKSKFLISIIFIIVLIYICLTIYKYSILKNIQNELIELNKSNNFIYDNGQTKWYYKDGLSKWEDSSNTEYCIWFDGDNIYSNIDGELSLEEIKKINLNMTIKFDDEDINLFKIAINPLNTIKTVKIDGIKYIEIKYGNEEIRYFNAETKIPVLSIIGNTITNYKFEQNVVTTEDVKVPDNLIQ